MSGEKNKAKQTPGKQIGLYRFTKPIPLDEAKRPKEPGLYVFLTKKSKYGTPTVRYIGKAEDLQHRVNYSHPAAQKLFEEVGREPDYLLVAWHREDDSQLKDFKETNLINHFKGTGKLLNIQKNPKLWKENQ